MGRKSRYSPEVRERAVRLVLETLQEHRSEWAAISSVASKMGCTPETLRKWVRQTQRDAGQRPGLTTDERSKPKQLERENFELKRANEILRKGLGFFRTGGVRPPTQVMVDFIGDNRDEYGVEPICTVLPIAPATYYEHRARRLDPERQPKRHKRDERLKQEIQRVYDENFVVYGAEKVWKQSLERPFDLVERQFEATRPNQLWVADITCVATWAGFAYVAMVSDAFSRRMVGWRVSRSREATSPSMPWSKLCMHDQTAKVWSITATGACSTCRFATPIDWQRLASPHQQAASATRTTTHWPRASTASTRPS